MSPLRTRGYWRRQAALAVAEASPATAEAGPATPEAGHMAAAADPATAEVGLAAELSIARPASPVIKQEPLNVLIPKKRQGYRKSNYFHITQAEREWLIPVKDTRPHGHTVSHHKKIHQVGQPQVGAVYSTASQSILSPFPERRRSL